MTTTAETLNLPDTKIGATFYKIWFGQFISMIGTMLTSFSLGVWLFQRTGSVLAFTQLILFSTLPALLLLPWTGGIADRRNKRLILMICDGSALICTAAIGLLVWMNKFEIWQLYAVQIVLSIGMAFQGPAAFAAITNLVPKSQFGRANGMFGLAVAVSQIGAPLLAATLLGMIGLMGIIGIDLLSFCAAILSLAFAEFPVIPNSRASTSTVNKSALGRPFHDMRWAIEFLRDRPTIAITYAYISMGGFLSGMVIVLITPLVLSNHSAQVLAWVTTSGALGTLLSGAFMIFWGGPKRWTPLILGLNLLAGGAIAFAGISKSVAVLCVCAFIVMLSSSTLGACMQTVWRRKVPRDRQGSVAALQQAVALSLIPLSAVFGGMLSNYFFEPALMPGGQWFETVGLWFGTGKGRGTGFFMFVVGIIAVIVSLFSLTNRRLYNLESDVADAF